MRSRWVVCELSRLQYGAGTQSTATEAESSTPSFSQIYREHGVMALTLCSRVLALLHSCHEAIRSVSHCIQRHRRD